MLAPMENYTDIAFRTLCFNHGCDLTFTEFASTEGLVNNIAETWELIKLNNSTPTVIQLLVGNEEKLGLFLKKFTPLEGFKGFNFNFGCPDPEIVKSGRGCAMVKKIQKANRLISMVRKYNYPISIKMRLGENTLEKEKKVYLNLIKETNPDFFIVHARSGEDSYEDIADYSVFKECVNTGKEIIANGDIDSIEKVRELKKMGVRGVMIGRSAVTNPAIFDFFKGNKIPSFEELKGEYSLLTDKFKSKPRCKKNVLMRIGQIEEKN
jgi:tRNA-dihydrouridine synthase B